MLNTRLLKPITLAPYVKVTAPSVDSKSVSVYDYSPFNGAEPETKFGQQFLQLIEKIKAWGIANDTGLPPAKINHILDKFVSEVAKSSLPLPREHYDQIKKVLEEIYDALQQDLRPLTEKRFFFNNMLTQMTVCSSGMFGSLQYIRDYLTQEESLLFWLAQGRTKVIADMAGDYFLKLYGKYEDEGVNPLNGMRIHVDIACSQLAHRLALGPIVSQELLDLHDIYAEDIKNHIDESQFLQDFYARYSNTLDTIIANELAKAIYKEIEKLIAELSKPIEAILNTQDSYNEFCRRLQLKLDLLKITSQDPGFVSDIPIDSLLTINDDGELALKPKKDFLVALQPYIRQFCVAHYLTVINPVQYRTKDGDIFVINNFDVSLSWVKIKKTQHLLTYQECATLHPEKITAIDPPCLEIMRLNQSIAQLQKAIQAIDQEKAKRPRLSRLVDMKSWIDREPQLFRGSPIKRSLVEIAYAPFYMFIELPAKTIINGGRILRNIFVLTKFLYHLRFNVPRMNTRRNDLVSELDARNNDKQEKVRLYQESHLTPEAKMAPTKTIPEISDASLKTTKEEKENHKHDTLAIRRLLKTEIAPIDEPSTPSLSSLSKDTLIPDESMPVLPTEALPDHDVPRPSVVVSYTILAATKGM